MSDKKRSNQPALSEESDTATQPAPNAEQIVNPEALVLDAPLPVSKERAATDQIAQLSDTSALTVSQEPVDSAPVTQTSDAPLPVAQKPAAPGSVAQAPDALLPVAQEPAAPCSLAQGPDAPIPVAQKPAAPGSVAQEPDAPIPVAQKPAAPDSVAQEPEAALPVAQEPAAPDSVAQRPDVPIPVFQKPAAPGSVAQTPTVDPSELESPILSDKSEHSEPNSESITSSSVAPKSSTTGSESKLESAEPISEQGIGSKEPSSEGSRQPSGSTPDLASSLSRTNTQQSFSTSDSAVGLGTYQPAQCYVSPKIEVSPNYRRCDAPGRIPDVKSPYSSFDSSDVAPSTVPSPSASVTIESSEGASPQVQGPNPVVASPEPVSSPDPSQDTIEVFCDRLFLRRHREEFFIRFFGYPRTPCDRCLRFAWNLLPVFIFVVGTLIVCVILEGEVTVLTFLMVLISSICVYFCIWAVLMTMTGWAAV